VRRLPLSGALAALVLSLAGASALAADTPPTEYAARHVLVAFQGAKRSKATRTKDEAKARAQEALAEAKKPGADFAAVSKKYNDDLVADAQGGFLGIFEAGTMTPVFQKAVEGLPEGGFSDVVETEFGFHVIQRMPMAEAVAITGKNTAALEIGGFSWQGLQPPKGAALPPSTRTKEQALADAKKAAEALRGGKKFADLPADVGAASISPGWRLGLHRGRTHPDFKALEDAAFALAVGDVSDPVETPAGYVVVKRLPYFRARVRHLLVMHQESQRKPPTVVRTKAEARTRAEEALAKVKADPKSWGTVVADYSDEPGAGARQGALPIVEPGTMVPAFEDVVVATAPGATSGVFETEFGFHVLQRLD
jgi:peptidyl-prolyl cis-trans isomerase SurA